MAYGMEIRQNNGNLWISPDFTPLNFVGVITYPVGQGVLATGYSISTSLMIFAKADSQVATSISQEESGGNWIIKYSSSGSGRIYLFANTVNRNNEYGIAMYNNAGVEVWNTSMLPLQVNIINNPGPTSSDPFYSINTKFPTAVSPGVVFAYVALFPGAAGQYLVGLMRCIGCGNSIYIARAESEVVSSFPYFPSTFKNQFYLIDTSIYD